jgi:hypothetical protein
MKLSLPPTTVEKAGRESSTLPESQPWNRFEDGKFRRKEEEVEEEECSMVVVLVLAVRVV